MVNVPFRIAPVLLSSVPILMVPEPVPDTVLGPAVPFNVIQG
jgi:hypothetical protein